MNQSSCIRSIISHSINTNVLPLINSINNQTLNPQIITTNQILIKMASPILSSLLFLLSTALPHFVYSSGGFSIDLIHRDSPNSPYYDPSLSSSSRLRAAAHRSITRANFLSTVTFPSKAEGGNSSFDSEVIPNSFEYLMTINVGTPPSKILAIADTGSDLTWTQCKPCISCYKQNAPIFDPNDSTSYATVSCNSDSCAELPMAGCGNKSTCEYQYSYGDRSHTEGILSSETFTFNSDDDSKRTVSIPKVLFGCSHDTNGTFDENGAGLVGLGGGPLSLVSQLGSSIDSKFSYCLVPFGKNSTSLLNFGDKADVGAGAVKTPIVAGDPKTFYYLTLEDISVGDEKVVTVRKPTTGGRGDEGNIIIDSGTTLTILEDSMLQPVLNKVSEVVKYEQVSDPDGLFDLCYDVSSESGTELELPEITFGFTGAPVKLPPLNTFVQPKEGMVCFAVVSSGALGGVPIFGNVAQQNLHVGYDLKAMTLSIAAADCEKL